MSPIKPRRRFGADGGLKKDEEAILYNDNEYRKEIGYVFEAIDKIIGEAQGKISSIKGNEEGGGRMMITEVKAEKMRKAEILIDLYHAEEVCQDDDIADHWSLKRFLETIIQAIEVEFNQEERDEIKKRSVCSRSGFFEWSCLFKKETPQ